jgi:uncharacterized protein
MAQATWRRRGSPMANASQPLTHFRRDGLLAYGKASADEANPSAGEFMSVLQIFAVLAPLAFAVGFALQRGNVCSVLAARQIAWTGRWSRLHGLLLASAWAFAVIVPIAWYGAGPFKTSGQLPLSFLPVIGGVLYAVGCCVNGACIFGVCSRLTAGNLSFIFTIPGMAAGATLAELAHVAPSASQLQPTLAAQPNWPLFVLWLTVVAFLAWVVWRMLRVHWRAGITLANLLRQSRWRSALAAVIIGVIGGLLFATDVPWIYPALIRRVAFYLAGSRADFPLETIVGSASLFLGGMAAAGYHGRFVFSAPHPLPALQSLIGGIVMGFAWALIPGGNDAMVLYLVPSLALHGILAYFAMLTTLIGIESLKRRGTLST